MKNIRIIMISFLLFVIGCNMDLSLSDLDLKIRSPYCAGGSLYPLHTKDCMVFEEKLTGKWCADSNIVLEFRQPEREVKKYQMLVYEDSNEGIKTIGFFDARLVKLENKLFIDIIPSKFPSDINDPNKIDYPMNALFFAPVHIFLKIDLIGTELKMKSFGVDGLEKIIEENPDIIKHEFIRNDDEQEDGNILITAGTKQLQEFIVKYSDDKRLFPDDEYSFIKCTDTGDKNTKIP